MPTFRPDDESPPPDEATRWRDLGIARWSQRRVGEAVEALRAAVAARPDFAEALNDLGVVLGASGNLDEALEAFRAASDCRADWAQPRINAGSLLRNAGRPDEALEAYRAAIDSDPENVDAHHLVGSTLGRQGRRAEATTHYLEALRLAPRDPVVHSSLLYLTGYDPDIEPAVLLNEHVWWDRLHGRGLDVWPSHANDRAPERRLRIGYVSADLRAHPVARFMLPIYEAHDREEVEVFSYARVGRLDAVGERLRALSDQWRNTSELGDAELAALVRVDAIDVLVDLGGHSSGGSLGAFTWRPAPVQASYLGYPGTTGLAAMRYRLTDAANDPPADARHYTEELVQLPGLWCCWEPQEAPEVSAPPCARKGHVTFGSLANLLKLNAGALDLWAAVLRAVPDARLRLARNTLNEQAGQQLRGAFAARGVAPERLELHVAAADGVTHLAEYAEIDVSLDALPWSGHTTTCESLWMGVPMVTQRGARASGRMAATVLDAVGLPELVAETPAAYVALAAAWAGDRERLARLRGTLREQVRRSPLCDGPGFTRGLEATYRDLWRRWCRTGPFGHESSTR